MTNRYKAGGQGSGQKSGRPQPPRRHSHERRGPRAPEVSVRGAGGNYWLYGWHSVQAALRNPRRQIRKLWLTENAFAKLQADKELFARAQSIGLEKVLPDMLRQALREDVPHQGIAMEVAPLPDMGMEILNGTQAKGPVLLLDQVTDPHNVGAILRSAAAFDAPCVIMTRRNSAQETGVVARAAAGALETVPLVRVANLVQAMLALKSAGYWCIGLDAQGETPLHEVKLGKKLALLLGAEGQGLRRLTLEHCDVLARLPMSDRMESLNVSNAGAIALYECYKMMQSPEA